LYGGKRRAVWMWIGRCEEAADSAKKAADRGSRRDAGCSESSFGSEAQVLVFGDLAKTGKTEVLVATWCRTHRRAGCRDGVTRAVVAEKKETAVGEN